MKHGQISCHPIFAGKRKVEYKPSFFEALEKRESVVFDANTLIERAMKDVQEIITGLKENPIVESGVRINIMVQGKLTQRQGGCY